MKLSERLHDVITGKTYDASVLREAGLICTASDHQRAITAYLNGNNTSHDWFILQDLVLDLAQKEKATYKIERLAEALWNYYYPTGGSVYATYASTKEEDKEAMRKEAIAVAEVLDGKAEIIPCKSK